MKVTVYVFLATILLYAGVGLALTGHTGAATAVGIGYLLTLYGLVAAVHERRKIR